MLGTTASGTCLLKEWVSLGTAYTLTEADARKQFQSECFWREGLEYYRRGTEWYHAQYPTVLKVKSSFVYKVE